MASIVVCSDYHNGLRGPLQERFYPQVSSACTATGIRRPLSWPRLHPTPYRTADPDLMDRRDARCLMVKTQLCQGWGLVTGFLARRGDRRGGHGAASWRQSGLGQVLLLLWGDLWVPGLSVGRRVGAQFVQGCGTECGLSQQADRQQAFRAGGGGG